MTLGELRSFWTWGDIAALVFILREKAAGAGGNRITVTTGTTHMRII